MSVHRAGITPAFVLSAAERLNEHHCLGDVVPLDVLREAFGWSLDLDAVLLAGERAYLFDLGIAQGRSTLSDSQRRAELVKPDGRRYHYVMLRGEGT